MIPLTRLLPVPALALSLLFSLSSTPASAQIPVTDVGNLAENVVQTTKMIEELQQMADAYQKQLEQLQQAVSQTQAITGGRNMGSLLNSAAEQALRRSTPSTWSDTLDIVTGGTVPSSAADMKAVVEALRSTYDPAPGADFDFTNPDGPIAEALDRRTKTTYAALAASETAYDATQKRTAYYESMLAQLDASNDLKASVDLSARIAAENGMAINELIRLMTVQTQLRAARDNQELTDSRRAVDVNAFNATTINSILD